MYVHSLQICSMTSACVCVCVYVRALQEVTGSASTSSQTLLLLLFFGKKWREVLVYQTFQQMVSVFSCAKLAENWDTIIHDKLSCKRNGNMLQSYPLQVIKNIRNVTRHRNGRSVKSRQTRWEWQLLISIMHIHDVVTRYNNCTFLCAWHVKIMVFFALPPCCVDESYTHVCVPKLYLWMIM